MSQSQSGIPPITGVYQFQTSRPSREVSDGYAWTLFATPFICGGINLVLMVLGHYTPTLSNGIYFGFASWAIHMDRRTIQAAGLRAPSWGWVFISPVYLWRRGTVVGRRTVFWWMMGSSTVLGLGFIAVAVLASLEPELLTCAEISEGQVTGLFNTIDEVRRNAIKGTSLDEVEELSSNADQRVCVGVITAVDSKRYKVTFKNYLDQGTQRLQVWAR